MVRSFAIAACLMCFVKSISNAQSPTTRVAKTTYQVVGPALKTSGVSAFSDPAEQQITNIVSLSGDREIVATEDRANAGSVLYKIDLNEQWRGLQVEQLLGIVTLVSIPSRNEVAISCMDSTVRFYAGDTLESQATVLVDRSASRLAVNPDGSTVVVINEGYADADVSDGRELWSIDAKAHTKKSTLGIIPFRGFHICFSPNGKAVAMCGGLIQKASGAIAVWDTVSETQKFDVKGPNPIFRIAYSNDGKWIVATGMDGTITIDAETGKQRATSPHRGRAIHVLPGTDTVLLGDLENKLVLMSLPELKALKTVTNPFGSVTAITSLDKGRIVVTGTSTGLQRWNSSDWSVETLGVRRTSVTSGISPALLSSSGLMALGHGMELRLCDAERGSLVNSSPFESTIWKVASDEKKNRFGIILEDDTVHTLEVLTGRVKKIGKVPSGSMTSFAKDLAALIYVSPSGELTRHQLDSGVEKTATTKLSGQVTYFTVARSGEICCALSSNDVVVLDANLNGVIHRAANVATDQIVALDWSSIHRRLAIAEKSGRVSVLEVDAQGQFQVAMRQNLSTSPKSISLSDTSDLIAVGQANGIVSLFSVNGTEPANHIQTRTSGMVTSCLFLNNDQGLVIGSSGGTLKRIKFQPKPRPSLYRIKPQANQQIQSACLSLTGDECYIAIGKTIEVKSTKTWETKQVLGGHRDLISRVRVSPDGKWLASTGRDAFAVIRKKDGDQWEIDNAIFLPARGYRLEWSPDGRWLLVSTETKQICVVDAQTWEIAHTFDAPFIPNTFSFSADSHWVVGSGFDSASPADVCLVWDASQWMQSKWSDPKTLTAQQRGVEAVAMTEDGQRFYSVAADSILREWSTAMGTSRTIRNLPMSGTSFSLLPDPRFAVVSWHFASLAVLDLRDGSIALQTEGHSDDGENVLMRDVVVSKDGQWAVSCAAADLGVGAGSVRLWRIGTQKKSP